MDGISNGMRAVEIMLRSGFFMRVCVGRFQREKNFGFIFMGSGIGGSCLDGRILYDFIRLG